MILPATGEGPLPSAVVAKAEDGDDRVSGAHLLVMMVVVDDVLVVKMVVVMRMVIEVKGVVSWWRL